MTAVPGVSPDQKPGVPPVLEAMSRFHLPDVVSLERSLFAVDSPWNRRMFADEIDGGHHYRVLLDGGPGGPVIGYAGLAAIDDDDAEVRTIGVHPGYRGQGLGRRLINDLLTAAGHRRVLLEVRTDNTIARALYESVGFTVIGVRRGYYQPSGADAHVMQRIPGSPS